MAERQTSTSRAAPSRRCDLPRGPRPRPRRIATVPGEVIVVSLGFDTYHLDPIGDLALTTEGYREMGRRVGALGRRLVVLQEGGYHVGDLGTNAVAWLRGADGR